MNRLVVGLKRASVVAARSSSRPCQMVARGFAAEALTIPTDKEQQGGRRKEELDAEAAGSVGFNRDPIVPLSNAGTKENPILVRFFVACWRLLNSLH